MIETGAQILSAIFALAAAYLWWLSTRVSTPNRFPIHVVKPDMSSMPHVMGGTYVGHGHSPELTNLANALKVQSRRNMKAAFCAGGSAAWQALAIVAHFPSVAAYLP